MLYFYFILVLILSYFKLFQSSSGPLTSFLRPPLGQQSICSLYVLLNLMLLLNSCPKRIDVYDVQTMFGFGCIIFSPGSFPERTSYCPCQILFYWMLNSFCAHFQPRSLVSCESFQTFLAAEFSLHLQHLNQFGD